MKNTPSVIKVTRKVVKVKPTNVYNLHLDNLSEDEARTIVSVCNRIAGKPEGRRGLFDKIRISLTEQGADSRTLDCMNHGSLTFTDIPLTPEFGNK